MRLRRGLPARAAQRGFTLVEVLIVMVIIGVSASLVLSSFDRSLKTSEERQWVEKTLRQLNRIKAQAILSGRPQQLNVNFANATLAQQVDAATENVLLSLPEKYQYSRPRGADETAVEVLDPADDKLRLTFYPDGSTSGASFDLTAPKTGTHHILVHGLTGKVEEARGNDDALFADLQLRPLKNGLEASTLAPPQPAPPPPATQPGAPGTPSSPPPTGAAPQS